MFKGDNTAAELESRHQKGENCFCSSCPLNSFYSKSIFYTRNLPYLSLEDRNNKIRCSASIVARIKSNSTNYFANMSKDDVIIHLRERDIKFSCRQQVKYLTELLEDEMPGIKKLPALMFRTPDKMLEELSLSKYQILNNQPLHDDSNHLIPFRSKQSYLLDRLSPIILNIGGF